MAHNVFDLHNGVIHQDTNHQRERQQSHHVDGKTQVSHADECRDDRQRQGHSRYKGGAKIAQKQPHHQHRQSRTLVQQHQRAAVFFFDRCHKIKRLCDIDVGVLQPVVRQSLAHQATHGHFALTFAAHHLKAHHSLTIQAGGGTRLGQGVFDRSHLVQTHTGATRSGQLYPADFLRCLDRGQGTHGLLTSTQVHAATRALLLNLLELTGNFGCRDAQ